MGFNSVFKGLKLKCNRGLLETWNQKSKAVRWA